MSTRGLLTLRETTTVTPAAAVKPCPPQQVPHPRHQRRAGRSMLAWTVCTGVWWRRSSGTFRPIPTARRRSQLLISTLHLTQTPSIPPPFGQPMRAAVMFVCVSVSVSVSASVSVSVSVSVCLCLCVCLCERHTCTHTHTHTHTLTHSLSPSHTQTHTLCLRLC